MGGMPVFDYWLEKLEFHSVWDNLKQDYLEELASVLVLRMIGLLGTKMSIASRGDGRTQSVVVDCVKETVGRIFWKQEVLEVASKLGSR